MNQITDMHCHILPGLDDGSKSMEETMEALREASRQGITSVIATPHYYPGCYEPDVSEVLHAWRQVKQRISLEGIPITLYPLQLTSIELCGIVAFTASPVATSSVLMVQELGGDEQLSAQLVVWSSVFSMLTVFLITFVLRYFQFL